MNFHVCRLSKSTHQFPDSRNPPPSTHFSLYCFYATLYFTKANIIELLKQRFLTTIFFCQFRFHSIMFLNEDAYQRIQFWKILPVWNVLLNSGIDIYANYVQTDVGLILDSNIHFIRTENGLICIVFLRITKNPLQFLLICSPERFLKRHPCAQREYLHQHTSEMEYVCLKVAM